MNDKLRLLIEDHTNRMETGRARGVDLPRNRFVRYYVETAVSHDAETIAEQTTFRCIVVPARSPKEAERLAIEDAKAAHPDATRVEFFMSRRLTDRKAEAITDQIVAKTWEGWRF
jgi:hypothetical protein